MTDLEMVRLCAEAVDIGCFEVSKNAPEHTIRLNGTQRNYWPLKNDEQAMALVKRLCLRVEFTNHRIWLDDYNPLHWLVCWAEHPEHHIYAIDARNIDLNRAICECAAKVRKWQSSHVISAADRTPPEGK